VNAGNKVRLSNRGPAPLAGSASPPPETSMESSSSVTAVDPEGTVEEVALELDCTNSSLLPSPVTGEVGTDGTLREAPATVHLGHPEHTAVDSNGCCSDPEGSPL
jgi:hypothetical protein